MNIRKATSDDLRPIWDLFWSLAENEQATDKVVLTLDDMNSYLFGTSPCLYALVAEEEGCIQGIALYYYRVSTWVGKTIHLEDLVVNESYRGKGLGRRLFQSLAQVAKSSEARRIEWEVSAGNTKGKRFYAQLGADLEEQWQICRMEQEAIIRLSEEELQGEG